MKAKAPIGLIAPRNTLDLPDKRSMKFHEDHPKFCYARETITEWRRLR